MMVTKVGHEMSVTSYTEAVTNYFNNGHQYQVANLTISRTNMLFFKAIGFSKSITGNFPFSLLILRTLMF